jgi:hypothetical protein
MSSFITVKITDTVDKGTTTFISEGSATAWATTQLVDSGATFQTDGVAAGDIVKNTDTGNSAAVVAIVSQTELTLIANIAGTTNAYNIFPPTGNILVDQGENFSSTVKVGDTVLIKGVDGKSAKVSVVLSNNFLTLDTSIFADQSAQGVQFVILSGYGFDNKQLIGMSESLVTVDQVGTTQTKLYYTHGAKHVMTVSHTSAGTNLMQDAFNNALLSGNLNQGYGPSSSLAMPVGVLIEGITLDNS